jgi:predicted cupin superfamily sugar epimerase
MLVERLIADLRLEPHPEGGLYREYYRSSVSVPRPGSGHPRPSATLIYFALRPGEESRWHMVTSDEIWLWQAGGELTLELSDPGPEPGGQPGQLRLGGGGLLHALVPAGHWQRARPAGIEPVLVSCMVTPGFDFADFKLAGHR